MKQILVPKETDEMFTGLALQLVVAFSEVLPPGYENTKWIVKKGERWYVTVSRERNDQETKDQ